MAYRERLLVEVQYGHAADFLAGTKRVNEICAARGWAPTRVMAATAGPLNTFVVEREYPDLAAFQRESDAFFADAEAFEAWRSTAGFVAQGASRTELWEDVELALPTS